MKKAILTLTLITVFTCFSQALAATDMEIGEVVGRYVGGALFVQKIATRCPAFSKNRITMESAYRDASSVLPERLSSELSTGQIKDLMSEMSSAYETHANQLVAQYKDSVNEDTRCGLTMGMALSIYYDGKTRLGNIAGVR
jgi:hypothetical protein